jgi:hypothetical protein
MRATNVVLPTSLNAMKIVAHDRIAEHLDAHDPGEKLKALANEFPALVLVFSGEFVLTAEKPVKHAALDATTAVAGPFWTQRREGVLRGRFVLSRLRLSLRCVPYSQGPSSRLRSIKKPVTSFTANSRLLAQTTVVML